VVLARGTGQSVMLDDRITVTVLGVRATLVRLGVEVAPDVGPSAPLCAPRPDPQGDRSPPGQGHRPCRCRDR